MVEFDVTIKVVASEEELSRLRAALRPEGDDLSTVLPGLAMEAMDEWLDQILARQIPARVKDARELRLLHYAQRVNGGRLPSPDQIAALFHLTPPEARTLHRNTRTRYSFELEGGMTAALKAALTVATWVGDPGYVRMTMDEALYEHADLLLRWSGKASTPRISNDAGYGDYRVPLNALVVLCEKLDVDYDEALAQAEKNAKATAED